ncbi:MAG: RNA polymerase sigma-70 factor [Bacteroidetes bacterium]|nr:RNA polymerase sigma-70 factor [Bacteroidota bacterium]
MDASSESEISTLLYDLKRGSERAFERLYKMHSGILLANIRGLVKDQEVAREILQDLYVRVWENRASIDPSKSYKSFLFTVARNLVYDHFRKISLDQKKRSELMRTALTVYSHVEESILQKESEAVLTEAINHLPDQCRRVYQLSKIDGKSHKEISELLNISLATVNNHIVKANRQIRSFVLKQSGKTEQTELSLLLIATLLLQLKL